MTTREPVSDLAAMLAALSPVRDHQAWWFVKLAGDVPANAFALIPDAGEDAGSAFARIMLMVDSSLEAVGLTAAVSGALAAAGIACNVVAGLHHDHLFVPWDRRAAASRLLRKLSRRAAAGDIRPPAALA